MLKSNLGRAVITQQYVTGDIVKLVATLSTYSKQQSYGQTGAAYMTGFTALRDLSRVTADLSLLQQQLQQVPAVTTPDGATIVKDLHAVAGAQADVAKDSSDLLNEWNQHVQLDANAPGTTGIGSHDANPFNGLGGGGGGQQGVAVMEVRPLLVQTLKNMDRASAALNDMHPALVRAIAICFSHGRRQATGN